MSSSNQDTAYKGQLGLWDAISIIVGIVIGTTIYKAPVLIFASTSDPYWGLLVWVFGGFIALVGAFCYAELATTHPKAGGDYFYLTKGFGPTTGFLFGWAQLTVVMPASIGAMAYVFSEYFLKAFYPNGGLVFEVPVGEKTVILDTHFALCAMVVLGLALTNLVGVLVGKWVQNLLTAAKIIGLGALIVCGLGWSEPGAWNHAAPAETTPYLGSLAIILVMYAFGGWNDSAFVAAEVRNVQKNIPRALFIGIAIIVLVYVLVNAAYINNLGWSNVNHFGADSDMPLAAKVIAGSPLSEWGGLGMSILVMVSALGAVNGLTFTGARVYATLGADHRLFGWMGHWRPGRGAPIMAIILQALLTVFIVAAVTTEHGHNTINQTLGYVNVGVEKANGVLEPIFESIGDSRWLPPIDVDQAWKPGTGFEKLVDRTAPVFWLFFMLTGFSLFLLREKYKKTPRPFSVPWYPIVPLIFCNSCAWMLYQATSYVGWHALFAVVLVLLGLPFYWLSCLIWGRPGQDEPDVGMTPVVLPETLAPRKRQWN